MEKFKYKVTLIAEIEAFDESDAWDAVQDAFGIGDNMGVVVSSCDYKDLSARRS